MRSPPSRQRDLFEVDQKMLDIPNTQKPRLVSVIERMLVMPPANPGRFISLFFREVLVGLTPASIRRLQSNVVTQIHA